jgi:acyl-CoA oxidase
VHGKFATVFCDLVVEGVSHGVHAVVVPIRDAEHKTMPGVTILDCGHKVGLHGIDNGVLGVLFVLLFSSFPPPMLTWHAAVIIFKDVRVPRDNLLNRFADVSPDGVYSSAIKNPGACAVCVVS